jgi:hypothetical protein
MLLKINEKVEKEKSFKIVSEGKNYYCTKDNGLKFDVGKSYEVEIKESHYKDTEGKDRTSKWITLSTPGNKPAIREYLTTGDKMSPVETATVAKAQAIFSGREKPQLDDTQMLRYYALQCACLVSTDMATATELADSALQYISLGVK